MIKPRSRRLRAGFLKWIGAAVLYTFWQVHERIGMDLVGTWEGQPLGSSPPHPEPSHITDLVTIAPPTPGGIEPLLHWSILIAAALLFLYGFYEIHRGLLVHAYPTSGEQLAHHEALDLNESDDNDETEQ